MLILIELRLQPKGTFFHNNFKKQVKEFFFVKTPFFQPR